MSNPVNDLETKLINNGIITQQQMDIAKRDQNLALMDRLILLEFATLEEIYVAWAQCHDMTFLDLSEMDIPEWIIELVPESVARENFTIPIHFSDGLLTIAISDPTDTITREKLQFVLNKAIRCVLSPRDQIIDAINRHYGQTETQSVDSCLQEFTDTQINLSDLEFQADDESISLDDEEPSGVSLETGENFDEEFCFEDPCSEDAIALQEDEQPCTKEEPAPQVNRHATVRYYHRMTCGRLFPLLFILSAKVIQEVVKRNVSQSVSRVFRVQEGSVVEVEPVLPGCTCYPEKAQVEVGREEVSTNFWVQPNAPGKLSEAKVIVRQDGKTLAEVPLEIRVGKQTLAILTGVLSLLLPFLLLVLKHFRLDFESQLNDGFGLYAQLLNWSVNFLTPELLAGILIVSALGFYWWFKPRKRDVFWDIQTIRNRTAEKAPSPKESPSIVEQPLRTETTLPQVNGHTGESQYSGCRLDLLRLADKFYAEKQFGKALSFYERAMGLIQFKAQSHMRASIAAYRVGDAGWALAILRQAVIELPEEEVTAPFWYNMACYATQVGKFREAIRYLNRAVDVGYNNKAKLRNDPDLEPLRWHAGFKALLAGMGR